MSLILIIFLSLVTIIVTALIIGLFTRKEYNIIREICIDTSSGIVFNYVKMLKNQDNFNKWVMVEPSMKKEFTGTDGTVGFIYAWNGKKAGAGELEIKHLVEGNSIETEIRFIRPFVAVAEVKMTTEELSENQTKITWSNKSSMKYPMNVLLPLAEKILARDMDISLGMLKNILEKKKV
jgi:hypothetical protein